MRRYRRWLMKRRIKKAFALLKKVDIAMKAMNMPRHLRKQMWRDFIKSPTRRMDMLNILGS